MIIRRLILVFCFVIQGITTSINAQDAVPRLYIPKGQIFTRPFSVYIVNEEIMDEMKPALTLTIISENRELSFKPNRIFPKQKWIVKEAGKEVGLAGTLMIFDISDVDIPIYKSCLKAKPIVEWNDKYVDQIRKMTQDEIFIGNLLASIAWTFLVFLLFLFITYLITKEDDKKIVGLISTSDGMLSMSLFQMAIWTIAVGFMVFCFGILYLEIPEIPETLIWLMGMAAGSSTVGHYQAHKRKFL